MKKVSKQQAAKEFIKEGYQIVLSVLKNFYLVTQSVKYIISNK